MGERRKTHTYMHTNTSGIALPVNVNLKHTEIERDNEQGRESERGTRLSERWRERSITDFPVSLYENVVPMVTRL